jgi:GT2 family glycosyltransferase
LKPFISVVIPTFNRKQTLEHVLPTLARQTYPADLYEILLSDSGSADGTEEFVRSLNIDNFRFITGENRGRSGARNRGVIEAKGDLILFTDADILADEQLLEEHARLHEEERNIAIVGCEVQVDSLEEYEEARAHPEKRRRLHPETRRELPWLYFLTGNASAPKADLVGAGLFDESFTGYGHEDLELGYRLRKRGMRIRYNPKALNYHWHPVPFDEKCAKMRMAGVSTVRFYRKHRDPVIPMLMGMNPFSMALQSLMAEDGWLLRTCRGRVSSSHLCSELVLQYHYLCGVKEALAKAP